MAHPLIARASHSQLDRAYFTLRAEAASVFTPTAYAALGPVPNATEDIRAGVDELTYVLSYTDDEIRTLLGL